MPYKNPEDRKANSRRYYIEHREEKIKYAKEYEKWFKKTYPEKYKEKCLKASKRYREQYPEKAKESYNKWVQNNLEDVRKSDRERKALKRKTSLKYNLTDKVRRAINHCLKNTKNGYHWEDLVGYTVDELKEHLEQTLPDGYDWNDYLSGKLHIDHIIPIAVFNFSSPNHTDFKRCWSLKNLQLLPAKENLSKRHKLYKPFQPSLTI